MPVSPDASNTMAHGRYYHDDHTNGIAWRLISQGEMYLTDNIIMANALSILTAKMFIVMKVVLIVILTVFAL